MQRQKRQYGTWPSPISPGDVASGGRLYDAQWDDASETLVWAEKRAGKTYLLAQSGADAPRYLTDGTMAVRGGVGYGGGGFTVAGGMVIFAGDEGRLYRVPVTGGKPSAITPAFGACAAPCLSADGRWVIYVHSDGKTDGLALVDAEGQRWPHKLIFETDFVMQPAWHPSGELLACVVWNHPQMPWDGTRLMLVEIAYHADGTPFIKSRSTLVGDDETAIFQPEFSPDGRYLSYVSDTSGWGQLYLYDIEAGTHTQVTQAEAEHGQPAWIQGMRTYGWAGDSQSLYYLQNIEGFFTLSRYDLQAQTHTHINALDAYTHMEQLHVSPAGQVSLIASSAVIPPRLVSYNPADDTVRIQARTSTEHLSDDQLAPVEPLTWDTTDGERAYGLYYPPAHDHYTAEGPAPLIVYIHGGPTSQKTAGYESDAQFFATRGYGLLFVNHRGSTGYGRDYMLKLRGEWGRVDVDDALSGAQHLVEAGRADAHQLIIMGGSAGGFTVLQALVNHPDFFAAGICRYGVSNQFMLVQETHKFEARYNDSLLGPLPSAADLYRERSPYFHASKINDPLIIFQGTADEVVPKSQSDMIVKSLKARGVPHEYHVYQGEGHGFRQPENVRDYYEKIVSFLENHIIYS